MKLIWEKSVVGCVKGSYEKYVELRAKLQEQLKHTTDPEILDVIAVVLDETPDTAVIGRGPKGQPITYAAFKAREAQASGEIARGEFHSAAQVEQWLGAVRGDA